MSLLASVNKIRQHMHVQLAQKGRAGGREEGRRVGEEGRGGGWVT